jgi:DNA polymerase-3 subunit epsilon
VTDPQLPLEFDNGEPPRGPAPKAKPRAKPKAVSKPTPVAPLDVTDMAALVAAHPDYRVIRRLQPVDHFARVAQGQVTRVVVLDTETTGLDHATDKIIELALLRVDVDNATGLPVGDVTVYDGLEDPGMPVSAEIQAITGISTDMVRGKTLDVALIATLLSEVDLVIAHNAGFDRPFCEARLPVFAKLAWGCSFVDIDWKAEGQSSSKLEYLALDKGWFYDAHRAEVDCHALLAVLAEPLPQSGQSGLAKIMAASRAPSFRLQATNAPFEAKDLLKSRAYRWNAEHRVWHTRLVDEAQLNDELIWLKSTVYANRPARVQVEKLDARVNYSSRVGEISMRQL